jgi:hypothetical protein
VIDHVGALIDLVLGELATANRVVPGSARGAGHVLEHFRLGVGRARALLVAAFELADQRNVHAADEADLAGLGGHAGQNADEVGAFFFLVDDRADVRLVDDGVDDDELGVREFGCDLFDRRGPGEGHGNDRVEAAAGEVADRLLALGVACRFEVAVGDTGFLLELLGAVVGGFVEGFVELSAVP